MQKNSVYIIALISMLLLSCSRSGGQADISFNEEIYSPRYAKGFAIKGAEGKQSTVIEVSNPWQGADGVEKKLFIARNGEEVPEGFDGEILDGDAAKIVAMSSTQIAMLEAIGEAGRVTGVSGIEFISSPEIQKRRDEIADVGYEGNVDYELLLSLEPDIVLLFGTTAANSMEGKLRELGVPYLYVGEYLEESPLGKAEWIVALAEIIGTRDKGKEFFDRIPERYDALKEKVAQNAGKKPMVMLNTPYSDIWSMPSRTSYMPTLISDAGGEYLYDKETGNTSMPIDVEEAFLLVSQADLWLNVGQAKTLEELKTTCPKFTDTRCFREGMVYNNNARLSPAGGNDFFESAVVRPDIVLRDLIKIFHPELIEDDLVYYIKLQ